MESHNMVRSCTYMAIGYRLSFVSLNTRMKITLMITKYAWKLLYFIAIPLFLKGIIEKVKKAFYESD